MSMSFLLLISAIGLVLVIEGMLPFVAPRLWRQWMLRITQQSDNALRIMGLISLLIGAALVVLVHVGLI